MEDFVNSCRKCFGISGIIVVINRQIRLRSGCSGTTGVGIIHQVIQQVCLSAVAVDAKQSGIVTCLNGSRITLGSFVEGTQLIKAGAGRIDSIIAVAARSRCTVGDKNNKSRISISAVQQISGRTQRALPVRSIICVIARRVVLIGRTICTAVIKILRYR